MKPRLAVIVSHPIQHFAPVYQFLAASGKIEVKVFFLAENGAQPYHDHEFGAEVKWDVPLTHGYRQEFVEPGRILKQFSFFSLDSSMLLSRLNSFKPDFVWLNGYTSRANWRVLLNRPNGARIIYGSDSNLSDPRSWLRRLVKLLVVKFFLRRCHHFLSISPANHRYLNRYGVADEKIVDSAYPVEMTRLIEQCEALCDQDVERMRTDLQIPLHAPVILFAGKLIQHKRPQDIVKAITDDQLSGVHALFIGSGAMLEDLKQMASDLGVVQRCHFVGFVNQSKIGKYFSLADIFVFPSEKEPYGAIAAETLPFGLPMVVSEAVGAIGESVLDGQNALLYPVGNLKMLTKQLTRLLADEPLCRAFAKVSVSLAITQDKSVMARDIIDFCLSEQKPD